MEHSRNSGIAWIRNSMGWRRQSRICPCLLSYARERFFSVPGDLGVPGNSSDIIIARPAPDGFPLDAALFFRRKTMPLSYRSDTVGLSVVQHRQEPATACMIFQIAVLGISSPDNHKLARNGRRQMCVGQADRTIDLPR